jgi:hypothetical protein
MTAGARPVRQRWADKWFDFNAMKKLAIGHDINEVVYQLLQSANSQYSRFIAYHNII